MLLPACLATDDATTSNDAATNNDATSNNGDGNVALPTGDSDFTILHCNNQETQRARVLKYSNSTMKVLTLFRA